MSHFFHSLAIVLLILSCSGSFTFTHAAQAMCDTGEAIYPCPTIGSTMDQWGLSWRNYTAIGFAGKGIFNPNGTIMETLVEGYPTLVDYFNGVNANKSVIDRTVPVGIMWEQAGNRTAFIALFFLPDKYLMNPPAWVNETGFLHINTYPIPGATLNPIVYSFLNRATNEDILRNVDLLRTTLTQHRASYFPTLSMYVAYNTPQNPTQQNEVWVFQENPFPGHTLTSMIEEQERINNINQDIEREMEREERHMHRRIKAKGKKF